MKRVLAAGGVVASLLFLPFATADAAVAAPAVSVAVADHQCTHPAGTTTTTTTAAPSSSSSSSGDEDCAASSSSSSSASSSSSDDGTASASSDDGNGNGNGKGDDDQVSVVPDGGAPTGDGSTDGSSAPYWVGGGLAVLLAAAGVTLRKRIFTRS